MGNQNSNQVQLASMRNLLVEAEGSKPGESAEGAKPDGSPLVIPSSATGQKDTSILKKKSKPKKSKSKEKRSLTPVNVKQSTVKFAGVSDDPGLSSLAIDLIKSQEPKKVTAMDIININKTIRFVEIHQTIKPDLHDTIELIAGPILGYNIEDLNETLASSQEVVAGRLSFSDNLNNFNEKFKFRSGMYNQVLNTVKLETLKQNPMLYADRSKVILAHKAPGTTTKPQTESIFEMTAAAAKNREREFSPEFFTPRDSATSQHRRIDSKTLKKILGHSSVNKDGIQHSKKVSEDLRRIEGALARIEKREELSKSEFVTKSDLKMPAQEPKKPNSRNTSLTQARSARALSRSKSPKPDSPNNGRNASPGFVIAKPQGATQTKKKTSTTPTREAETKKSTTTLQTKKIQSSITLKKPSVSSQASVPLSAKTKKIPSLNVVLDNIGERSSQHITSTDEARRQPQTARYTSKKIWKEAERPKSKSPKSQSSLPNESRQRIDSLTNLQKTMNKGPKTPSSPLANEYVKYVNTTLNQTQVDRSIPIKTFDISTRKISTPQITEQNLMRADSDEPIVMNLNLTAPEFSKPQSIKEINNRGNYAPGPSNVMAVESRDTNDFSNDEDDIQPIEATLDLSAYIANSLAYQDDQLIRGLQDPREKQNLNPLMSDRSYDRGIKGTINSARGFENDLSIRNYKNTEPEWGNVQISKKIESEAKPKASMYTKREVEAREENEDYGDNLMGENFDENNYLEEIRKKMAKISGKNENPPPSQREIFKKEPSKNFEPIADDIETKENISYRSNVGTMPTSSRNKLEDSNYVRRINFGSQPIH